MKKQMFLFALCFYALLGNAQTAITTFQNIVEVKAQAAEEDKNILLVFSGSDWCKPCIQLKETILSSQDFTQFSESEILVVIVDFPYKKKNRLPKDQQSHNELLAEKYNQDGVFPKSILIDADENVLGQIVYNKNMNTAEYLKQIEVITSN